MPERIGLTLDDLLADLDRDVQRTWGAGGASAGAPAAAWATSRIAAIPRTPETLKAPEAPETPETREAAETDGERCLLVTLAGRRFAVPARAVLAVTELPPVSAVPFAPSWLRGVARAAGGVVAVLDLARLLSFTGPSPAPPAEAAPSLSAPPAGGEAAREILLVVKTADADLDAGLAVRGVARLACLAGAPGRPPASGEMDAGRAAFVAGLVPDPTGAHLPPVAVLDIDRLLRRARDELST